ncbi:hypothetical protein ACSQ67_021006 [Phaseolus vulgaris]
MDAKVINTNTLTSQLKTHAILRRFNPCNYSSHTSAAAVYSSCALVVLLAVGGVAYVQDLVVEDIVTCSLSSHLPSFTPRCHVRRHQISLLIPNLVRQSFKWPTELGSPPSTTTHLQRHH